MDKAFNNFDWEDFPSTNTPLDEKHLNEINKAVNEIDNRVIHLDATKASALEMSQLFSGVAYDEATGIITFTRKNGATITIDTKLEKLAVNFSYDPVLEQLIIVLDDGTEERVDLSALITQYEFLGSDTIAFQVQSDGKVTAIVKEGSIEEKHLRPNYLADVRIEVGKAAAGAAAAERSAQASATSETNAAQSEAAAADSAAAAQKGAEDAEKSAQAADKSAADALASQNAAEESAQASADSEAAAADSAAAAQKGAEDAAVSAAAAAASEESVAANAEAAERNALLAKSWAVDGTGIREGEKTDNAKYYCQQAHGFRDESEQFSQSAENAVEQINKKLGMVEFDIDDDGNLIYTDDSGYIFTVDDDGMLNWEVA